MHWISACLVLHNIAIEVKGSSWVEHYAQDEAGVAECGMVEEESMDGEEGNTDKIPEGGSRRRQLVEDYFDYYQKLHDN
ncbi:hypothetical protein FS749_000890 [Ceratobasidium sp. UAMH 11750]|nr:hypothetical protein FS749_000890 [Ceratobasidium sp. UAMH 11750]